MKVEVEEAEEEGAGGGDEAGVRVAAWCGICQLSLDTSVLASHFSGNKHRKMVKTTDLRAQQEGKAVFVTQLGEVRIILGNTPLNVPF